MGSIPQFEKEMAGGAPDIVFPVELNDHLANRLQAEIHENCQLRSYIKSQDEQLKGVQRSNQELETKMNSDSGVSPVVAAKIVDMKKKNRDMGAQIESMKTKLQQLLNENGGLRHRVQQMEASYNANGADASTVALSTSKSNEDIKSVMEQLHQTTNKMMEYRRQCQQYRIDLRAALRALSQEIGDGVSVNPKNVLQIVGNPSWRGRQQQILTLTQKVNELQAKLVITQQKSEVSIANSRAYEHEYDEDDDSVAQDKTYTIQDEYGQRVAVVDHGGGGDGYDYSREIRMERMNRQQKEAHQSVSNTSAGTVMTMSSASQRHLADLQMQDKKKHEQLEKVTKEAEEYRAKIKHYQHEKKAFKARTTTLENQVRSQRLEIEELETKLKEKTDEFQEHADELVRIRQELGAVRSRERQLRESNSSELQEVQQSLARERAITVKLQAVLNERQDLVQKMGTEIKRLQSNLDYCCGNIDGLMDGGGAARNGGIDIAERVKQMKSELAAAAEIVGVYEKERLDILAMMKKLIGDVESERESHAATQQKVAKCFTVIDQTNDCLSICLDESQITCKSILTHVEAVRSLIREIKTVGDLYSLDSVPVDDVLKLKARMSILSKENKILHQQATKSLVERRRDLEQYGNFATKLRSEFLVVLQAATKTYSKHVD